MTNGHERARQKRTFKRQSSSIRDPHPVFGVRLLSRFIAVLLILVTTAAWGDDSKVVDRQKENRPKRLEWLQDAGFGMFVHWSQDSQLGCVISHSLVGASPEYSDWYFNELPKTFNPRRWDADELASLAKLCGMRYVVLTAKHHCGFCLWDTKTTDFSIMNTPYAKARVHSPYHGDILAEYVAALRRHGLAVGIYYSPEDFAWLYRNHHPVRRRNLDPDPNTDAEYSEFIRSQVRELFTNYGPIDVLFIDGEGEVPTKEVAWSLQPNCLITRGAIETPEQHVPGVPPKGPWESNLTMGTQWQYKPTNDEYKSGTRMLEILIETRAKGGALLLNVGPKPNGELPIEQEARLREVALWHAVNGPAIHDTRPWVVTNEEDIWFTKQKDSDTLYVFLTRVPNWKRGERKEFLLRSVQASDETEIRVMGQNDRVVEYAPDTDARSRFQQTEEGLRISVVRAQRLYNDHRWPNPVVVRLTHAQPAFERPPHVTTGTARATLGGRVALHGDLRDLGDATEVEVGFEYQVYGGFATAMYNTEWTDTKRVVRRSAGAFSMDITGLRPGTIYQYRALVKHPKITMRGDHRRFESH